jgi:hypothetical protein
MERSRQQHWMQLTVSKQQRKGGAGGANVQLQGMETQLGWRPLLEPSGDVGSHQMLTPTWAL